MNKTQRITIIGCLVFSLLLVGGAIIYAMHKKTPASTASRPLRTVGKAELAKADGKDGHVCYVAVDGTVYQIEGFGLWENGQHEPSNGQAYCGADMTAAINKSPHGRKVLDVLSKVGPLGS